MLEIQQTSVCENVLGVKESSVDDPILQFFTYVEKNETAIKEGINDHL